MAEPVLNGTAGKRKRTQSMEGGVVDQDVIRRRVSFTRIVVRAVV